MKNSVKYTDRQKLTNQNKSRRYSNTNTPLKGLIHPKMKILLLFNPYDILLLKKRNTFMKNNIHLLKQLSTMTQ